MLVRDPTRRLVTVGRYSRRLPALALRVLLSALAGMAVAALLLALLDLPSPDPWLGSASRDALVGLAGLGAVLLALPGDLRRFRRAGSPAATPGPSDRGTPRPRPRARAFAQEEDISGSATSHRGAAGRSDRNEWEPRR